MSESGFGQNTGEGNIYMQKELYIPTAIFKVLNARETVQYQEQPKIVMLQIEFWILFHCYK